MGLYGGKLTSDTVRFTITNFIVRVTAYARAIEDLNQRRDELGLPPSNLQRVSDEIEAMLQQTRTSQTYVTPMDATRLALLFFCMSTGMLASVTLGLGAMLKRKEAITTGFLTCVIAIFLAWFSFGINWSMAVVLDDGCVTLSGLLDSGNLNFAISCISQDELDPMATVVFDYGINATIKLAADENAINTGPPAGNFFVPITVDSAAISATRPDISAGARVMISQYNATTAARDAPPCSSTCNTTQFNLDLLELQSAVVASTALAILSNCSLVQSFFNELVGSGCPSLIKGIVFIFVGNLSVGILLIPAAIMGLYVHQKFPNRSSAAMTKTRMMVLFMYQFFLCLVCVLSEVNTTWDELLISIGSIIAGIVGFLFLNIPMNRWDWPVWAQVVLACFLGVLELACLGGWIWLFYNAIVNNMACSRQLGQSTLGSLLPEINLGGVCDQFRYMHTLIVSILGGIAMMTTLMAAFLALVFSIKTIRGTQLNLEDSDFELD